MITRDEILRRARAVPQRSDPYNQSTVDPDGPNAGYRPDCSGWVSYCWGCPRSGPGTWGGYSTATFVTAVWAAGVTGIMVPILRADLRPGDAIGYCAPSSPGNGGHIALWLGHERGQERILDHGGGWGPVERFVTWASGTGWNSASRIKAFRFRGVDDDGPISREGDTVDTKLLQEALSAAGYDLGPTGVDGVWGPKTAAALTAALRPTPGPRGPEGPAGETATLPIGAKLMVVEA